LTFKSDIDCIFGATGNLLNSLDTRSARLGSVEPSSACLPDRFADVHIGSAPAKMASERCSHVGSRRRNGTLVAAPLVVKCGSLDHKSRCAEAALEGIRSNERLLHRMQPIGGMPSTVVT
jgi:hypothetical protein